MTESTRPESLFADLSDLMADEEPREAGAGPGDRSEGVQDARFEEELAGMLDAVTRVLPVDEMVLEEDLVKENLEELTMLLVALREGTHGKELMGDLARLSGVQLSPGTVYPVLHALEEEDVLSMHKKVRTKEYTVEDDATITRTVESAMIQHLAFGLLLYAFLSRD